MFQKRKESKNQVRLYQLTSLVFLSLYLLEKGKHSNALKEKKREAKADIHPSKIQFTEKVLDAFRQDVGRLPPETGVMLASSINEEVIDLCHFDKYSKNSMSSFSYNVPYMSKVFREWRDQGAQVNGVYHSHPMGSRKPTDQDIQTACILMDFFQIDYFYLPIFQTRSDGKYTMYFYILRKEGEEVLVHLEYVLKAEKRGYSYPPFKAWNRSYKKEECIEGKEVVS